MLGGALACFAGYRLFRIVLAIYGFILGAMLASSMMGVSNTTGMIVAALVGGLAGALDPGVRVFRRHRAGRRRPRRAGRARRLDATCGTGDPPALAVIVAGGRSARSAR